MHGNRRVPHTRVLSSSNKFPMQMHIESQLRGLKKIRSPTRTQHAWLGACVLVWFTFTHQHVRASVPDTCPLTRFHPPVALREESCSCCKTPHWTCRWPWFQFVSHFAIHPCNLQHETLVLSMEVSHSMSKLSRHRPKTCCVAQRHLWSEKRAS